jgi:hypothetical protein
MFQRGGLSATLNGHNKRGKKDKTMSLQNAYSRLWDDLMREGRGLRSTVLGELLWTTQTRLIQQYATKVGRVLDLGAGHLSYRE